MNTTPTNCIEHSGCIARIDQLETSDTEQWKAINAIRNRPPVWCTVVYTLVISTLTFGMGFVLAMVRAKA